MKKLLALGFIAALTLTTSAMAFAKGVAVDLKPFLNFPGIAPLETQVELGFDYDGSGSWASFDAAYFPKGGGEMDSKIATGIKFNVVDPLLEKDNVESDGQEIPVTVDNYKKLYLMVGQHHGAAEDYPLVLKYDDGTSETATFSATDWCQAAAYDEIPTVEMDHRVALDGSSQALDVFVWGITVKVNPDKKLKSIVLAKDAEDELSYKKTHFFAMTLETK